MRHALQKPASTSAGPGGDSPGSLTKSRTAIAVKPERGHDGPHAARSNRWRRSFPKGMSGWTSAGDRSQDPSGAPPHGPRASRYAASASPAVGQPCERLTWTRGSCSACRLLVYGRGRSPRRQVLCRDRPLVLHSSQSITVEPSHGLSGSLTWMMSDLQRPPFIAFPTSADRRRVYEVQPGRAEQLGAGVADVCSMRDLPG